MIDKAYARADAPVQPQWLQEHLRDSALRIVEGDVSPARYDAGRWSSFGFNNGVRANLHNFGNGHHVATRQKAEGPRTVAGLFHHP